MFDTVSQTVEHESKRKIRTLAGNWQLLFRKPRLFNPFRGILGFQMISHKLLRILMPGCLISAAVSNLFLFERKSYILLGVTQGSFYLLSLCGYLFPGVRWRIISIPRAFVALNAAAVIGLWSYMRGTQNVQWK